MKYLVHSVLNKTMRMLLEIVNGPRITLNLPTLSGVAGSFQVISIFGYLGLPVPAPIRVYN